MQKKLTPQELACQLIAAIREKNYSKLESLAKSGDVNARDENNWTALLEASKLGDINAIDILLANKANPDLCEIGFDGRSPMGYAAIAKCEEGLKRLLEHGGKYKNEALAWAVYSGSLACTQLMIVSGADINTRFYFDGSLRPPVIVLAVKKGHREIVDLLIRHEVDVNAAEGCDGKFYSNSLMLAANADDLGCLNQLLEAGAEIDAQNVSGQTALMYAVKGRSSACLKVLLEKRADPNLQNYDGITALHIASKLGADDCVELLLEHNAAANLATKNHLKPMYFAVTQAAREIPKNTEMKIHYLKCTQLLFKRHGDDMSDCPDKRSLRMADDMFKPYLKNIF